MTAVPPAPSPQRVIADDEDVVNYMIKLTESIERTRSERVMGWYHSHPFDVSLHSHCFLSQTDMTTQLQWQRSEDPHGNPFLAVVVDPLRSLAKGVPTLKAFRAYPPEYSSPVPNECPNGAVVPEEQARLEMWGSCWSRYYELDVEYFMSGSARNVMSILTHNFLWMKTLGTTPMLEAENRARFPERVVAAAEKVRTLDVARGGAAGTLGVTGAQQGRGMGYASAAASSSVSSSAAPAFISAPAGAGGEDGELSKATRAVADLAVESLHGNMGQVAKRALFS